MEYGQFCPIAKASEILGEKWTILIVRELLMGARRFSDLQRGLTLISPTLLSKRLDGLTRRCVQVSILQPPVRVDQEIPFPSRLEARSIAGIELNAHFVPGIHYHVQFVRLEKEFEHVSKPSVKAAQISPLGRPVLAIVLVLVLESRCTQRARARTRAEARVPQRPSPRVILRSVRATMLRS